MKNFFKIIFLVFIFSLNSCSSKDDIAKIFFFDVNQGDSSFVTYNNISILIDTGEKIFTNDVIKILKSKNIKNIDYLILTHDHSDHSSGFFEIYDNFKIKNLILPDTLRDETFNEIENFLENSNITINYIKNPSNLKISNNFNIKFLSSFKNTPEEFNDSSLVFKLSINDFDVLYTGDIEENGQLNVLNQDLKSEILKVPHHGAYNNDKNNVEKFLTKVTPLISIISVGPNSYGHPNKNTLNILNTLNSKILRTDEVGNILITCNFENDSLTIDTFF